MKRILLVRIDYRVWSWLISPPLGILYLASVLRKKTGEPIEVELLDLRLSSRALEKFEAKIREFRPDILGISVLTVEDFMLHQKTDLAKKILPDCKIIVGGPHATAYYEDILKDHNVDYAVIGEGENTLLELVNSIIQDTPLSRINGIAYRENGQIFLNENRASIAGLDALDFPAWDLIDFDSYSKLPDLNRSMGKGRYAAMITSRACPYQCAYCHAIFGKSFHARSPENVLQEINLLQDKYSVEEIQIFDDCFNYNLDRAKQIGASLCSRGSKVRLSFPNGVRGDLIDREFLEIFRKAGAYTISIAVETASSRLQKLIRKNLDLDKVRQTIYMAKRLGYIVHGFFMIGFPTETPDEIKKTIKFAIDSPLDLATFFTVTPYRKTPLMKLFQDWGFRENAAFEDCHYGSEFSPYRRMTGINLRKVKRDAYLKFYLNPRRFFSSIMKAPNKSKYIYDNYIRMGVKYLWNSLRTKKPRALQILVLLLLLFQSLSRLSGFLGTYLEEDFEAFILNLSFVV